MAVKKISQNVIFIIAIKIALCNGASITRMEAMMTAHSEAQSQHTPGPWCYIHGYGEGTFHILGRGEEYVAWCEVRRDVDTPTTEANVRLIAAGPETAAALASIIFSVDAGDGERLRQRVEIARSILIKAGVLLVEGQPA